MRSPRLSVVVIALSFQGCAGIVPIQTGGAPNGGSSPSGTTSAEVVTYTNEARAQNGLAPLSASAKLMDAARIQAQQMAAFQVVDHTISGAQYPTLQSRLQAVGYSYSSAAENIAWNQPDARSAMNSWMSSSGHRANILDPNLREMGAAMARSARGEPYWVQVFGTPR